jgi:hypothetical protein
MSEEEVTRTIDDIEYEIKAVDTVPHLLRADSSEAMALETKLAIQKHIRHVEGIRARLRRELFAVMDEAGL